MSEHEQVWCFYCGEPISGPEAEERRPCCEPCNTRMIAYWNANPRPKLSAFDIAVGVLKLTHQMIRRRRKQ